MLSCHPWLDCSQVPFSPTDSAEEPENKALQAEDDDRLKVTRQLWLFNKANLSPEQQRRFNAIK